MSAVSTLSDARRDTYVVRLWLPDRPGALGAVASRIGAVGGDVVGIQVLEREGGCAVDELVVELPEGTSLDLLVNEICEVDGVAVEDVRRLAEALHDPRLEALESAAQLVAVQEGDELGPELVAAAGRTVGASWVALVDVEAVTPVAQSGSTPSAAWLAAFVVGRWSAEQLTAKSVAARDGRDAEGPPDIVDAPVRAAGLVLLMGRDGTRFRVRERRQVAALARIADARWRELRRDRTHTRHPAAER